MIKRITSTFLFVFLFSTQATAEDLKVLPVLDSDYNFDFAIAATGGLHAFDNANLGVFGLDVSFNCLLLSSMRTQLSVTDSINLGTHLLSVELNPQYTLELLANLTAGLGPVLGTGILVAENSTEASFNVGAGLATRYVIASGFFVGAEARYVWDTSNFSNPGNGRYLGKIGYQF